MYSTYYHFNMEETPKNYEQSISLLVFWYLVMESGVYFTIRAHPNWMNHILSLYSIDWHGLKITCKIMKHPIFKYYIQLLYIKYILYILIFKEFMPPKKED